MFVDKVRQSRVIAVQSTRSERAEGRCVIRGEERMPRLKFDALIEVTARVRRLVIGTPGGGVMLREQIIGKGSGDI